MTVTSLTGRNRADPMKLSGVVYTPPTLARFLAEQAFDALGEVKTVRILDPACGDGELLLAALNVAKVRDLQVKEVVGYDIDASAVDQAATRLAGFTGVALYCADFLQMMACSKGPMKLSDVDVTLNRFDFDLIISNPPYVRTQTMGADAAQALGEQFGLTGRIDLYQAFAVAMIRALSPGGALGLLCSNKFLTNRAGSSMRHLLLTELQIKEIVDLGDTKLFDASVLPVIVSGSRSSDSRSRAPAAFRSVYELPTQMVDRKANISVLDALTEKRSGLVNDGERSFVIRSGWLDRDADPDMPWNPVTKQTKERFEVLRRANAIKLGAIGRIRVGVKTTADAVFIRSDWQQLPENQRPEPELLRPLLTHKDIRQWCSQPGERKILYPHREENGRAVAVDLANYPKTSAYLESHRQRLEGRKYVIQSGRKWYEIWVPQKPGLWASQKVVFPDIAKSPRFAIDRSGAVVNGDCYWIVIEDDDLAEVVAAVGNSSFCTWFYDAACGNFLYAGRRRFMTQYIERLPIPKPTRKLVSRFRELRLAEDVAGIDAAVWSALRLEQP